MSRTPVVRVGRPRDGPAERVRAGRPSVWRSTRRLPPRHGRGVRRTRHRRHVVRTRRSRAGRTARPIPRGSGGAAPTAPPVRPRRSRMAFHPTNPPIRYRRAPSDQTHLSNRLPCPDRAPPTCDSATRKCHKLVTQVCRGTTRMADPVGTKWQFNEERSVPRKSHQPGVVIPVDGCAVRDRVDNSDRGVWPRCSAGCPTAGRS